MGLLDLPSEIILLIAEFLSQGDLNALQQTNRSSHSLLYSALLRHNIRVHTSSALFWAAEFNDLQLAGRLFREGDVLSSIEPKVPCFPLFHAAENGSEEMVKLLLEHGANPSPEGIDCISAIHIAAEKGYVGICEIPLSATSRTQVAEDMIMAMWIVVSSCDLPIIEAMIERCGRFYSPEAEENFDLQRSLLVV